MSDGSELTIDKKVKRSEKSLCEITKKFLCIMADKLQTEIHLDNIISVL